ncbi:hypothetical protein WSS_A11543 [Rhodococcus opacus M213]|uniref:Uncharacterized protein n=1 Tax=Rhodococcus opacus M213 TaxID=1129896 RepID=K8XWC6_RHOOP|nr:hypothetical protein [Rhodococcus opacus]EKT82512.1 hypothetical protein WSS_A11543 [Rhodococcus opacus M213]
MITAVCAVALGVLLAGSDLADRWRGSRSERARIVEITASLDRFQWLVLEDLAEARRNVLHRDRAPGNDEIRAFIAARERATGVGIPGRGAGSVHRTTAYDTCGGVAVYRLPDRLIREWAQQLRR